MSAVLRTPTRHPLTLNAVEVLLREGILAPDARVELIDGDLFDVPPIGPRHTSLVNSINQLLVIAVGGSAIVQCQSCVRLSERSVPQPDFALLRPRADRYRDALAGAEDILLLIEVADTTVDFDRTTKARLYARHGIGEYWLFDLNRRCVEQHREPGPRGYGLMLERSSSEVISPLALPALELALAALFQGF